MIESRKKLRREPVIKLFVGGCDQGTQAEGVDVQMDGGMEVERTRRPRREDGRFDLLHSAALTPFP